MVATKWQLQNMNRHETCGLQQLFKVNPAISSYWGKQDIVDLESADSMKVVSQTTPRRLDQFFTRVIP